MTVLIIQDTIVELMKGQELDVTTKVKSKYYFVLDYSHLIFLQLMEDGDPGPAGLAAPSLVVQDTDLDLEGVMIRLQLMAGEIVQDQALPEKTVTLDVAQVIKEI